MAENDESRRTILRKGAAFVIPTIAAFKISEMAVAASGGNHYGDTLRSDMNSNDNSQWDDPGWNDNQGPL